MIYYLSYVSKSECHGWQRISLEYVCQDTILRDRFEFAVVDDDLWLSYHRKLDIYIDSELGDYDSWQTCRVDEEEVEIMTELNWGSYFFNH